MGAILAGGIGKRMGNIDKPKQYLEIGGKPVIVHTAEAFLKNDRMDRVIILCPEEWISYTEEILAQYLAGGAEIPVIAGGKERNDTIMNAISYIESEYGGADDVVLVTHDAVRPFVTSEIIDRNINAIDDADVVDTVVPATDTIVHSTDNETIDEVPNRAELYQGQTPQTFRAGDFRDLYKSLTDEEKGILTDAVKAFVIKGKRAKIVEGSQTNIKITYQSDIDLAETILGGL